MSTVGERKCALLLVSLRPRDRRRLLASLPRASAVMLRRLVSELEVMPVPVAELAEALLVDEAAGVTPGTSVDLEQLAALVRTLPPAWSARVLAAWGGFDGRYCLSLLDPATAAAVASEMERVGGLPPKLVEAMRMETVLLAAGRKEAA